MRALAASWSIWTAICTLLAGIETVLAILFPPPRQMLTVKAAQSYRAFDRTYYRAQLPAGYWFYRLFPLRHYAVFGEVTGFQPNAGFCPLTYLRLNPDVADAGVPPFWHWLTKGRDECRRIHDPVNVPALPPHLRGPLRFRQRQTRQDFATHIHVHHTELLDEVLEFLSRNRVKSDLFITLTYQGHQSERLAETLRKKLPEADVVIVENRGRDILPFLSLLSAGAFDDYQAVCKLHTKLSAHRIDGDRWRRRLLDGILRSDTPWLLSKFLKDPDLAIWVADGQKLTSEKWWGDNKPNVERLLRRIELKPDSSFPHFPAGSMYWIKPFTLGMLRALDLGPHDFEPETGALDGTTAHAVERIVGELALAAGQRVIQTSELRHRKLPNPPSRPSFVSAFYLPQFHRVPQNDAWWGQGYTEWSGVRSARPQFDGHLLARPDPSVTEYDLLDPNVMSRQATQAASAGIDAFCVYHYWFNGQRLLEKPLDQLIARPEIFFPFYLCWANESWRRNWDGLSGEVLIEQSYPSGFEADLAANVAPYMTDPRYQRPDGQRRRFVIYRPTQLPDPHANIARLRQSWRDIGLGEVEIGGVLFHADEQADQGLVDFWIEMPPHGIFSGQDVLHGDRAPPGLARDFSGVIYDYARLANRSVDPDYKAKLPKNTLRGIMPSWDNTARRKSSAHVAYGATPAGFRRWLTTLMRDGIEDSYRQEIMINAWNEWGEKAYLEPDIRFGALNLDALRDVVRDQ